MAAESSTSVPCPHCGVMVPLSALKPKQVNACPHCHQPLRGSIPTLPPRPAKTVRPSEPEQPELDLLGYLEDLLVKMIRGVFEFILIRVPLEIYRALVLWFPTAVRLIKIVILFYVWCLIVFGPLAIPGLLAVYRAQGELTQFEYPDLSRLFASAYLQSPTQNFAVVGYSTLALIGSGWGALYIRRKRKQAAILQAAVAAGA